MNYSCKLYCIYFRRGTYVLTSNSTLICFTLQKELKNEFRILPSTSGVDGKSVNSINGIHLIKKNDNNYKNKVQDIKGSNDRILTNKE